MILRLSTKRRRSFCTVHPPLRVVGTTSLADLHHIIQIAMGWDNDYLHCFHIFGKDYGIVYEGGLSFSDNPYGITLDDFDFDMGDRFTYTYNFFDNWLCDVRIEGIRMEERSISPLCTGGQGRWIDNKPCYRGDEALALVEVLDTIFNGNEATTTVGDIRSLIDSYEAVRFNRRAINKCLSGA